MEFDIHLDEDAQLVVQSVHGELTGEDFDRLDRETAAVASKLKNPSDIRILVDAKRLPKGAPAARNRGMEPMKRPELTKMAFWGGSAVTNVLVKFMSIVSGCRHKIRTFRTEQEARDWLKL